jgi:hypothetical protein
MTRRPPRPEPQTAGAVLMVRPTAFGPNAETEASNAFQTRDAALDGIAERALTEFDSAVAALSDAGIDVHVAPGRAEGDCPDEIFPNNWVSFHADGSVVLYPMLAVNRRRERRAEIVASLARSANFQVTRTIDLSGYERDGRFLEGTGSLVLDRTARTAYAGISPRTDPGVLAAFAAQLGYETHLFATRDHDGQPVYHTNVVMSLGTRFAVVCLDALVDTGARRTLRERLTQSDRDVIEIDLDQMHGFAANILELDGRDGPVIALSTTAYQGLARAQRDALSRHGRLVTAAIPTIETVGGGGLRCMLAEIHRPPATI